jgi:hypothetical protein
MQTIRAAASVRHANRLFKAALVVALKIMSEHYLNKNKNLGCKRKNGTKLSTSDRKVKKNTSKMNSEVSFLG